MALVRRHSARLCPFRWMRDCEETHERARFRSAAERSRLYIHYSSAFGLSHTRFKRSFPFFFVLLFVSSASRLMTEILFYISSFNYKFEWFLIYYNHTMRLYIQPTCFVCCGASFFSSSRWWWRGGLWDDSFVSIYEDSRSFPTSVCLFLGCWFIFFEICVDGPFRVVLFVSRFLFGQELTSRHVYIALIYT